MSEKDGTLPTGFNLDRIPVNEHPLYIDKDGDGYGVGPTPNGPDADDTDPTVTTYDSAMAKYGTMEALLNHLG
ncbi:hypothetical protein CSA56_04360, partial [candidate division KSB3 bacterium]